METLIIPLGTFIDAAALSIDPLSCMAQKSLHTHTQGPSCSMAIHLNPNRLWEKGKQAAQLSRTAPPSPCELPVLLPPPPPAPPFCAGGGGGGAAGADPSRLHHDGAYRSLYKEPRSEIWACTSFCIVVV